MNSGQVSSRSQSSLSLGGNAEFGFALLQKFADLAGVAAQETEFQPVEHAA